MDFPATHKERRIENERVRMCVLVVDLGSERVSEVECDFDACTFQGERGDLMCLDSIFVVASIFLTNKFLCFLTKKWFICIDL